MTDWKVGDIAICVKIGTVYEGTGSNPPLRLNAEYVVQKVRTCECGNVSLDVGLPLEPDDKGVKCPCGALSSPKTGIWWCSHKRFVKRITKQETEESLESILKQAKIELVHE